MANLSFVDAGFVWGLIISLIILCALVTLVVLIIRKKRKTVDIDVVNNSDISAVDSIVLSGGRNYTVGSNNKVKAGVYSAQVEESLVISINGVSKELQNEEVLELADGDNIQFDGSNKKLILKRKI